MVARQTNHELRSFGLIVGTGFAVIALWPLVRGHSLRTWALVISLFLFAAALIAPSTLRLFYEVWMKIGEGLGWVNSRIILGLVFFFVLLPIGLIRRGLGHDPMNLRFQPEVATYKTSRAKRPGSHLQQQH